MAQLTSNDTYKGSIGNLVFYKMNGKTYARKKRVKRSRRKKLTKGELRSAEALEGTACARAFGKSLRLSLPNKIAADVYLHSHLHSFLCKNISRHTGGDGIHNLGIFPEDVNRICEFRVNANFPDDISRRLRATEFEKESSGLRVSIDKLPIQSLARKIAHYQVWVKLRIIDCENYRITWRGEKQSALIPAEWKVKGAMIFETPRLKEKEVMIAAIGFYSCEGNKPIADRRLNGFVFLEVDRKLVS